MDENGENVACEDRCDSDLKREVNSAENQDDEPPIKCLKQEEDQEPASSTEVFFIDNKCDKEAFTRFMSTDSTNNTDEHSSYNIFSRTADFIQLDDSEPEEPAPVDVQPSVVCFNCGGKHFLNDCTEKINMARVSQKRREMARERDVTPKKLRYFEHEMLSQRFQPGKYSKELRKALDLRPEDLPPFIYRMRVLGYPPGWLTYAEVEKSGLTIYGLDDHGKPNENLEAGEVDKEAGEIDCGDVQEVQYDPARLVDFPGFNVPVPPGVRDLCEEYGMPPMLPHQQRSEAEKYMKAPVVAKSFSQRQKLPPPVVQPSTDIGQVVDMHIDDGAEEEVVCFEGGNISAVTAADSSTDSKCTSTDVSQESLVPEQPSSASDCNNVASSSSTEADRQEQPSDNVASSSSMEADRQAQPSDNVASSSSTEADRQVQPSDNVASSSSTEADRQERPSPLAVQNGSTSNSDNSTVDTPKAKKHKVTMGTPMLIGFSKYTSLPPRENFAKDMTDHIPFENLPGTTGRYDKLRTVIKKVRALREENDKNDD
ncbi:zinc finger CCHC domain-containing protein 8 homolog isoform X1 [Rhipicephalus sanguineus]|uniref:zinc finger CCHC domain-containing protein 8 homolog isoform X1 n=1 Tax=Rhipicephalus sanguineus TaxID=34632 RepID=UPI0018935812|nr:zinc finger CCHC domain-containing protein 8 homolog isoform X1 [Rhipicephalus sanguineus]